MNAFINSHCFLEKESVLTKNWSKFNEISLPKKESFYSSVNSKKIYNSDCGHVKKYGISSVSKILETVIIKFKVTHNY